MAKENKFNLGDIVKVIQNLKEIEEKYGYESVERMEEYQGREGLITSVYDDEGNEPTSYSLAFFDAQGEMNGFAGFPEEHLEATGKKGDLNKTRMSSTHLRVSSDGRILGVYDDNDEE